MTHPYRERPAEVATSAAGVSRLDASTLAFGLCCALVGQALAGPGCALLSTLVGVLLLLASGRGSSAAPRWPEHRPPGPRGGGMNGGGA